MKRLARNEQAALILIFAILFGAWFRLMPAWLAEFPVNDGGMFYSMIVDLQANHYAPPLFTTYNHLSIPFAYPPLGFYLGAFLSDLLRVSPIEILRWLPGVMNALTIPAFYFFAQTVWKDSFQSAVAALIFAFIPHLTSWNSMGGGLTRSLGMFFMLLTLAYAYRIFESTADVAARKDIFGAILFGSLTALSHTEAPIYAAAIALFIWAAKSRSLKGLLRGAGVALGVLLVGGAWYGLSIYRHGVAPFLSIAQTGAHSVFSIFKVLNVSFLTEEPYLGLLGALGVLGFAALLMKREFFIPLMFCVIYLAQPRSAHMIGNIPLALAAGYFAAEILLPALTRLDKRQGAFFALLAAYAFSNSMLYGINQSQKILAESERMAMRWARENTPPQSAFLVISGDTDAFCDPVTEWFPALSLRQSATTVQGREWLLNDKFGEFMFQSRSVQACIDEGLACLQREARALGEPFEYIYLSISAATKSCGLSEDSRLTTRALLIELEDSAEFEEIYRSEDAAIFEKR